MSIEFSFYNPNDGSEIGHRPIVQPGETKDRGQSYEWEEFNPDNEFIFGTTTYNVRNGEAQQVQLSPDSPIVVFKHSSDLETPLDPLFFK